MHGTVFYYTIGKGKEVVKALHKVHIENRYRVQHVMSSDMQYKGALRYLWVNLQGTMLKERKLVSKKDGLVLPYKVLTKY
jgi:hypothetical protein